MCMISPIRGRRGKSRDAALFDLYEKMGEIDCAVIEIFYNYRFRNSRNYTKIVKRKLLFWE